MTIIRYYERALSIELTPRDKRLLYDTYRLRLLPLDYIRAMHFDGSQTTYVYKRLKQMETAGLIRSQARFWGESKMLLVTMAEGGMELLRRWGMIVNDDVEVRYLNDFASKYRVQNLCAIRRFYIPLAKDGWILDDSRQFKRRRYLPNHVRMIGCLVPPNSEHEYAVYLLDEGGRDKQLLSCLHELHDLKLPRAILLYRSGERVHFQRMEQMYERVARAKVFAAHIHLLPLAGASAEILKRTLAPSSHVNYFTMKYGRVQPRENKFGLEPFEIIEEDGQKYYCLEYLSHDLCRLAVIRNYSDVGFMEMKQKLRIFTWDFFKEEVYRHVGAASHIEVVVLEPSELEKMPISTDPTIDPVLYRAPKVNNDQYEEHFGMFM